MSQRLLRKSRTNQNDQSQCQSQGHASPVLMDEHMRNFKIEFSDLSRKRLSDSGEVRDPTIYSQRKSRLSQFSQINNRQRDLSEHNPSLPQYTATTKQYYQLKWKELNGLPKQTDIQQIIKTFLQKLKRNANIVESPVSTTYFKENYLKQEVQLQPSYLLHLRQFFQYTRLISYILVPLQAGTNSVQLWVLGLILLLLLIEQIDYIFKLKLERVNITCNFVYIASTLLINFDFGNTGKLILLLLLLTGIKYRFHWNAITFSFIFLIYINYIANLWLLLQEDEFSYIESVIWTMNNCLPFHNIESHHQSNQIYTIIVQIASYYFQLLFLTSFIKYLFSTNEMKIFSDFLQNNKVDYRMIQDTREVLKENQYSNTLATVNNLMQSLPINLQKPLFFLMKSKKLQQISFFKQYFSKQSLDEIGYESTLKFYKTNEIIVEKGQLDEYMYVVLQGEIGIYDKNIYLQNLPANQAIGIENLLMSQGHNLTMRSKGNSILIQIKHSLFWDTIKKINSDLEMLHSIKNEVLFMNKIELLLQNCYVCGSQCHLSSGCNKVHSVLNKNIVISRYLYSVPQKREKFERKWDWRVNSLYNFKLVRSCGRRLKRNYGFMFQEPEINNRIDYYDEEEEEDDEDEDDEEIQLGRQSYKDLTNPSRKSVEMISGQTLRDIIYHDHIDNEEQLQYYQQQWQSQQQQQEINRHQVNKQTLQTAGFQTGEDLYFGDSINIPLQHKQFTQNSNTFRSSSGQNTYQSQKSQQLKQQQYQQNQQQTQQSLYQSKTYAQSPLGTNQLLVSSSRNAQPKLTFSYDPFYHEQNSKQQVLAAPQPEYQAMSRPQYRSSTNYVPSVQNQLPIVSEESNSLLNIPIANNPYQSAMSISSVGMSSIDEAQRRDGNNPSTIVRRTTQKQTNTVSSAVSPDIKKKSISASNSRSYSALSSRQNQHYSDLDNVLYKQDLKDNFDIDYIGIYQQFKPQNNYDCVVNQIKIQSKKLIKKKKLK
ncbi:unnamed protein product (macronuclear) [Paramecium tetraurelia]|uniref:Cyclic nucleotide-binding domain-containing protein n=1 Tax=Paramecium tetraurelia TaxID=5888 RepID=A0BLT3_PARTE|nr:uncharacterized protein GSPATT00030134001 [Paramecium tetraurelia]CAK59500.1 unnamed protein product [Paramecium tetraurelia]|eukprot:XP_001426898.1 hypothetical protein (macronuclear) [Paramecium tetraurelia strain d4-2]